MTDLEFASCDLEHIDEIIASTRAKKFYELAINDSVYAISVQLSRYNRQLYKYEFQFKGMERPHGTDPENTKARLYNIYFDEPTTGRRRRGIQVDKNRTSVFKKKNLQKTKAEIIIYATTLEECIKRTEELLHMPIADKLIWKIA